MSILSTYNMVTKLHAIFGIPAMTLKEIVIYKKVLLSLKPKNKLNIFEYGSGSSTIYFAKFLKQKRIPFHIHSVDNNSKWHRKVKKLVKIKGLDDVITLYLSEFAPFWKKDGWDWAISPKCGQFAPKTQSELEYINAPLVLGNKFDFVTVDGRFRRRCLEIIPNCLNENGIILLHDAQKVKYHYPISLYPYSKMIRSGKYHPFDRKNWKIWVGSLDNPIVRNI